MYWCQTNELPLRSPVPVVQTVHDLIPLQLPDAAFETERRRWRRNTARVRASATVIAVSQHTADQAIALLDLDPAHVHVIHNGVDRRFHEATRAAPPADPYVLTVAGFGLNKGYAEAFEAAALLADRGFPHRLKLVGAINVHPRPYVDAIVAAARRPIELTCSGRSPTSTCSSCMPAPSALLVTSRYEGFGLPAAEAMAVGTPVVGFDNSSIPEVVGDGGVLVPDGDVVALVDAVVAVLSDTARAAQLSAAGRRRAVVFDWKRSAEQRAAVFIDSGRASAMRVIWVTSQRPRYNGGAGTLLELNLFRGAATRHDVHVITPELPGADAEEPPLDEVRALGVTVETVPWRQRPEPWGRPAWWWTHAFRMPPHGLWRYTDRQRQLARARSNGPRPTSPPTSCM